MLTRATSPRADETTGRSATDPALMARILTNGNYRVLVTPAGTGAAWAGGYALTNFAADPVEDPDGFFLYVKDLETGALWSVGTAEAGERGEAPACDGRVAIRRESHGIDAHCEICVAPDADLEIRRVTLTNRSPTRRRLEIATFAAVVLDDPRAYAAHPGFSKLFVQTEYVPSSRAIVVRRRARGSGETHPWMIHALLERDPSFETSRERFLGRTSDLAAPAALQMAEAGPGTAGNVLDPIVCLRDAVELGPGESTTATFLLGVAPDRSSALELRERFARRGAVEAAFEGAAAGERARREAAGLSETEAAYFQRLAGAILYNHPDLRPALRDGDRPLGCAGDLERHGIAVRQALAVLHTGDAEDASVAGDFLRGAAYWRACGLPVEAVVVGAVEAANAHASAARILSRGALTAAESELLDAIARCVIRDSLPDLAGRAVPAGDARPPRIRALAVPGGPDLRVTGDGLELFNGIGGFDLDGAEYVLPLPCDAERRIRKPPRPWINVVANERFGFLVSETGAGYTWAGNSREHRLTPWFNDPLLDPHGEAIYVRDEATGEFWSALPGPAPRTGRYEMRHGFGTTRCRFEDGELEHEIVVFVPRHDPVKIARLTVANRGQARTLSFTAYARLVLGVLPEEGATVAVTEAPDLPGVLLARNRLTGDFGHGVAFAAVVAPEHGAPVRFAMDRARFLGRDGSPADPVALRTGDWGAGTAGGASPCFAQQIVVEVPAGAVVEVAFLLGEGEDAGDARKLVERYRAPGRIAGALAEARAFWAGGLGAVRIATPSRGLDVLVNGWLPYQTLACRIWGRSALYQSGGAFGFRDQLQDASALLGHWPELTREQILRNAAHQFVEGDVLHWWHPPASLGLRTRFADDLLWLPALTAHYVGATGDEAVLSENVRFLRAEALRPGEDEAFLRPQEVGDSADLYVHCCRAIDRSLATGAHGLPLFGTGDWNDGMNRVGRGGRGESVWMAFFLFKTLGDFAPFCAARGDAERVRRYTAHREKLREAVERHAWDGAWYLRGYYDDGTALGSHAGDECRIDALVQAWAVLSGAAAPERAAQAMDSVERHLVAEDDGLIRLLAPPFEHTPHDPGYIKGYVRGVRENGGQYTHAALWVVAALAKLGRNDRVAKLLQMLLPTAHCATPERAAVYQLEPYVVAADIYGEPPHVGRGGWSWYTGSAGWMVRVALESLLGIRVVSGREITISPCVPDDWPEFAVTVRVPGEETRYRIHAANPRRCGRGVVAVLVDGVPRDVEGGVARVPIAHDGRTHRVDLVLGAGAPGEWNT